MEQTIIDICFPDMSLSDLIVPAVVGAALTAVLASLLFFALRKRERRKHQLELRYAEYKKCLRAVEEVAAAARIDLKQSYTAVVASSLKDVLNDPEQSGDYGAHVDKGLEDLGNQARETFAGAARGLHGLGLVCSGELRTLVNAFVELQRELMEDSISLIADARISNPSASANEALQEKSKRADALFARILKQMREEVGLSS